MSWKEFHDKYLPNYGRHSVNYTAWIVVEQKVIDWFYDIYFNKNSINRMIFEGKNYEFDGMEYKSKKSCHVTLSYDEGNIEDPLGIMGVIPMPFLKITDGPYLDGFITPGYNNLLEEKKNLSLTLVDNTHWPALRRGSIALIAKELVIDGGNDDE